MSTTKKNDINIPPDEFQKFKKAVHLGEITFQSGNWQVDRSKFSKKNRLKVSYDTKILESEKRMFRALQKFTLIVMPETSKEHIVKIVCGIHVNCTAKVDISKEFWDAYAKMTLPIITVPYFREFVSNISGRMGIPTIYIPHWYP